MTQASESVSVVVVDDDAATRESMTALLGGLGCTVTVAGSVGSARALLAGKRADIGFFDDGLGDGSAPELVRWALAGGLVGRAYCMTADTRRERVVAAMRAGCCDVLAKPVDRDHIEEIIARKSDAGELDEWRRQYAPQVVGEAARLLEVFETLRSVAQANCTVLVTGETGTGKEVVARTVHNASDRRDKPFVALNCAAIPEALIEAELFGHTRGAFTGALVAREGRIAAASGGTLFLDEIGDMPAAAQAKLLRVLQERLLTPLGADRSVPVDVRIVAATNKDLEAMVEAGTFRADLFYRLSVVRVELPALRDRPEDVVPLARHFIAQVNKSTGRNVAGLDGSAEEVLRKHTWPGNVRELANTIERAVVLKRTAGPLSATDLGLSAKVARGSGPIRIAPEELKLKPALDRLEMDLIKKALEHADGNRTEAASLLGLNRTTLVEKLRKFAL
jgi:DNA-binding NtrC family response regulator